MTEKKRKIILGVTGGIAAYKSAMLCSLLSQGKFDIHVVMTANALKFVTALTFQTLSRNAVTTSLWEECDWRPEHVALSSGADLLLIAPCTANMLGKVANGLADDALSTVALSVSCPIMLAPAMNPEMWGSAAVRRNCKELEMRGVLFCGPERGHVACGADGEGRMSEPLVILQRVEELLG